MRVHGVEGQGDGGCRVVVELGGRKPQEELRYTCSRSTVEAAGQVCRDARRGLAG